MEAKSPMTSTAGKMKTLKGACDKAPTETPRRTWR